MLQLIQVIVICVTTSKFEQSTLCGVQMRRVAAPKDRNHDNRRVMIARAYLVPTKTACFFVRKIAICVLSFVGNEKWNGRATTWFRSELFRTISSLLLKSRPPTLVRTVSVPFKFQTVRCSGESCFRCGSRRVKRIRTFYRQNVSGLKLVEKISTDILLFSHGKEIELISGRPESV